MFESFVHPGIIDYSISIIYLIRSFRWYLFAQKDDSGTGQSILPG